MIIITKLLKIMNAKFISNITRSVLIVSFIFWVVKPIEGIFSDAFFHQDLTLFNAITGIILSVISALILYGLVKKKNIAYVVAVILTGFLIFLFSLFFKVISSNNYESHLG